ncbi:glycosyltransferase [Acidovorax sp. ACV01]|uniref:glycosyltransferase n=1 Tax=Acidovorax sp. ACV01 TaxID=2769311 RepID=UPI00351C0F4B
MPVIKEYGIYVAYPPTVDLRAEGLGRYLAAFLKGSEGRSDVRFTIVCPSWSHDSLEELFDSEGVPKDRFRVVGPRGKPYVLYAYEAWKAYQQRDRSSGRLKHIGRAIAAGVTQAQTRIGRRAVQVNSVSTLFLFCIEALPMAGLFLLLAPIWVPIVLVNRWTAIFRGSVRRVTPKVAAKKNRLKALLDQPQGIGFVQRLFADMEQTETQRMQRVIERLRGVSAWYCPAAFWPAFNQIKAPRLMCVPDVVLTDFPVGFSSVNGDYTLQVFENVEKAIADSDNLVAYSGAIKWGTLVDRYGVDEDKVSVIYHAPNKLDQSVTVTGFPDPEKASKNYCRSILSQAFLKGENIDYLAGIKNGDIQFLFYASQFRPNKNILSLLRAYEYLLRSRHVSLKLILTGNPRHMPEIQDFIVQHRLEEEVLCLPKLSVDELAACYKLATLAVNPSLSEGGCPFTFTEALSVGTPVVMAKIPVSQEVLTDPVLQELTFFDPYDWKDMAERIQWGVANREKLLAVQLPTYEQLVQRTWQDVVNEHLDILDRMVSQRGAAEGIS